MMNKLLCGAAVRDITPTAEMLPLPGGYADGSGYTSVLNPLHVRALALSDQQNTALLVIYEMPGVPNPDEFIPMIAEAAQLPRDYVFLSATHSHAVPMVGRLPIMNADGKPRFPYQAESAERQEAYLNLVREKSVEVAKEAMASMKPAALEIAFGKSYINLNRNKDFHIRGELTEDQKKNIVSLGLKIRETEDGPVVTMLGIDYAGVSDKTLTVLKFADENGAPIAFLMNHPTHATVMHGNVLHTIDSDFPGVVSAHMEKQFPGSAALWCSGAAGDQNPVMKSNNHTPSYENGLMTFGLNSEDPKTLLHMISGTHFDDVMQTIVHLKPVEAELDIKSARGSAFPESKNPDDPCEVEMGLLKIGPVSIITVHGELYNSIGTELIRQSFTPYAIVMTHTCNTSNRAGYIPDEDGQIRGGWGTCRFKGRGETVQAAMLETLKDLESKAR